MFIFHDSRLAGIAAERLDLSTARALYFVTGVPDFDG
jgi:hypothetical protein